MKLLLPESVCCLLVLVTLAAQAPADEFDTVPGAGWQYEFTPASGKGESIAGKYRVQSNSLYQPRDGKPAEVGKIFAKGEYLNKSKLPQKGDRRQVEFNDMVGHRSDSKERVVIRAKGIIIAEGLGEVSGRFTFSDGSNWNFKASRVKE